MPSRIRDRFFPQTLAASTPTPEETARRLRELLVQGQVPVAPVKKKPTPKKKKKRKPVDYRNPDSEFIDVNESSGDEVPQEEEDETPDMQNHLVQMKRGQIERVAFVVQEWVWCCSVFGSRMQKYEDTLEVCDAITSLEWDIATHTNPYVLVHHVVALSKPRLFYPRAVVQACARLKEKLVENHLPPTAGAYAATLAFLLIKRDRNETSVPLFSVKQAVREAGFDLRPEEVANPGWDPARARLDEHPLYTPLFNRATQALGENHGLGAKAEVLWIQDKMFMDAKLSIAGLEPEKKDKKRTTYARRDEFRRLCNNVSFEAGEFSLREFSAAEALLARNLYMLRFRFCGDRLKRIREHNEAAHAKRKQRLASSQ